jgi:hypothetical protein
MKFTKKYQECMQGDREKGLPLVGLKKLKKILKACRMKIEAQQGAQMEEEEIGDNSSSVAIWENIYDNKCSGYCPGTNFSTFFLENCRFLGYFLFGNLVGPVLIIRISLF